MEQTVESADVPMRRGPVSRGLRRIFERDTLGQAIFPLAVLTLLYFFDEFDTAAMGVLAPDIKRSFALSDQSFVGLVAVNGVLVALLTVPLGYYADRIKRTRIVVWSGLVAGICSLATGLSPSFGVLFAARFGNGLGLVANLPVHNSLLADYYTPAARPTVFANHTNGMNVGALVAPAVAGGAAAAFGWRAAFFVFFVPVLITSLVATRLEEPERGGADDEALVDLGVIGVEVPLEELADDAERAEPEDSMTFRESFKELWAIRPLRRIFIAAIFMGGGLLPLAAYLPLFLEREYGLGPLPRGVLGSSNAAFTIVGVLFSASRMPHWIERGLGVAIQRIGVVVIGIGAAVDRAGRLPVAGRLDRGRLRRVHHRRLLRRADLRGAHRDHPGPPSQPRLQPPGHLPRARPPRLLRHGHGRHLRRLRHPLGSGDGGALVHGQRPHDAVGRPPRRPQPGARTAGVTSAGPTATGGSDMADVSLIIGGERVAAPSSFGVINPSTGEVHAEAPECSRAQLDEAFDSSAKAYLDWRSDEGARRDALRAASAAAVRRRRPPRPDAHRRAGQAAGRRLRRGLRRRHLVALLRRPRAAPRGHPGRRPLPSPR